MIEKLYSDYDAHITIRSAGYKTFFDTELDLHKIQKTEGVVRVSRALEEMVVLKHEDKWSNATMVGVDSSFVRMAKMSSHMVDGFPALYENNEPVAIIGASLLDKLGGYIPQSFGREFITIYGPKRDMKMSIGKNPFYIYNIPVVGRINYNREVNAESLVVPIETAKKILGYGENELSAIYVEVANNKVKNKVKQALQEQVGDQFKVKTNDEKNELIFQTSKSERLIVIIILVFIFILASFNLVASLTMLFVEKKQDISILHSMGADSKFVFKIFFFEGLLIAGKGIIIGLILGYGICFCQLYFELLTMPNSFGEVFPIVITWKDSLLIIFLVSTLSVLASYFPVKMLVKRNNPSMMLNQ